MPKKTPTPPASKPARSSSTVTGPDLEAAKRDALLQLKIGRSAHLLTIVVSVVLGLDAILLLFFFSPLPGLGGADHGSSALVPTFYLLLPLLGALLLAVVAFGTKWGEFQFWPWETHFSTSVGGVALSGVALILYVGRVAGAGPFASVGLFPWFLALVLVAISVSLLGLALTWRPWGSRQWASAVCAVLPLATVSLLYFPPASAGTGSEPLAVALLIAAVLYQSSGSFLHLLSSGTTAHRDALVLSGQTRIGRLADDVSRREEALRFRELAVLKREANAESAETAARRTQELAAGSKEQLDALDTELRSRSDGVAQRERDVAGRTAELDGKSRLLDDRERALSIKSRELDQVVVGLNERATKVAGKEGEQAQRDVELAQRLADVQKKGREIPELQKRLEAREKQVEEKTADILRREGDVTAREQAVKTAVGRAPAGPTSLEQDLAAREARARHLKTLLDEQNLQLGQRAQEVAAQAKAAEAAQRQASDRQAMLVAREASLAQREGDFQSRSKAVDERQTQLDTMLTDYRTKLQELGRQQADVARKGVDVDRSLKSLPDREKSLADREAKIAASRAGLEQREAALLAREREAEANAEELSLRQQEVARASEVAASGSSGELSGESTGFFGKWMRSKPAGADPRRAARPASASQTVPDTLAAASGRRYSDRLPSGTPRLDDLLLGGLPPHSHVALVGDAFVGKEVALYAFIAEGLRRSEPVVLITATRSPDEVAQSLGVLLPQFREYEQMGKVTWIDATGSGASPSPERLVARGPDDLAGILSNLVQASKAVTDTPPGTFRVGFLGLSAVLAHGDERAGFSFLQNVVGILKPRDSLAMYSLEAGALSEPQVESLLGRMDGAILFRQDRDRTFLSVKGFGDVETREWIECRTTNRALVIGSFALERIR